MLAESPTMNLLKEVVLSLLLVVIVVTIGVVQGEKKYSNDFIFRCYFKEKNYLSQLKKYSPMTQEL